jgi:multisubunit Na+/H+ antiporter MnhC subunit
VAAAEKTERRRRGHPVWTVCSTAVARAMVVTAVVVTVVVTAVVVTVVGRVVLQAVGLLVVTELGRPQRNR